MRRGRVPGASIRTSLDRGRPARASSAASAAAPAARSRAARSRTIAGSSCGIRAAGVPGRGLYGKTWTKARPHSAIRSEAAAEHRLGLGRKAGDQIGAEHDLRAQCAGAPRRRDRLRAAVPPLHALQDQIVAGLQRQMQMRHQPRLVGEQLPEILVDLARIERGQPQAAQLGNRGEKPADHLPEARAAPAGRRRRRSGRPRSARSRGSRRRPDRAPARRSRRAAPSGSGRAHRG